jgi:hypothetical protein
MDVQANPKAAGDPAAGGHAPNCRRRTEPDGRRVADWQCLTPAEREVVNALLAASGKPRVSGPR